MKNNVVEATFTDSKTEKYYAWRASNYEALSHWETEPHEEAVRLAGAREGQSVLVAACGTGRGMDGLAKAVGPKGRIEAMDLSSAMIEQARAKMEKMGLSDRVHFRQGNVRSLPYPDESFDIVYNGYMFDLIEKKGFVPILEEMRRVLRPGGKLVLLNMSKPDGRKTFFERIYRFTGIPCRPVLMAPYLESLGFSDVQRRYKPVPARSFYEKLVGLLWGQEIVTARR